MPVALTFFVANDIEGLDLEEGHDASTVMVQEVSFMDPDIMRGGMWQTHSKPALMATIAPSFSLLLIATVQIIFHGSSARTISISPEYAATNVL